MIHPQINPSCSYPGQSKINSNFCFHTSLRRLKRFYEDLKDLHKTWGTKKKHEDKNLIDLNNLNNKN